MRRELRHDARRAACGVATLLVAGCAAPAEVRRVEAAHPGARYEATSTCAPGGAMARRFSGDLRAAVLWSRQVVREARVLPCEVVVEAVRAGQRQSVFRTRRARTGPPVEEFGAR